MLATAIVGGTIIDGNGGAPVRDGVIVTEGERIISVGVQVSAIPTGSRRVDATGKYIVPGLMDANVHLVYGFSTEYLIRFEGQFTDIIREGAQVALKSGVTTVFDTWGPLDPLKTVRDEINEGKVDGARIYLGGNIVGLSGPFSPDFYASVESISEETVQRVNAMYEHGTGHELVYLAPEEFRLAIRKYLAQGVDFLKYAVSGHADRDMGFILFSPGVQSILSDEARQRGLIVQTHTTSVESLRMAVDASVDLTQHCNLTATEPIPTDLVQEIVERKIPCAMQAYPQRYLRHALGGDFSADPRAIGDRSRRIQAVAMQNQRRLIEAGVKVLMMTDGGVPSKNDPLLQRVFFQRDYPEIREDIVGFFGRGHYAWLRGATDAGLSPMEALQAATKHVAAAYKKLDDLGTLEAGKIADLVILNANPLSNPANYSMIDLVMKAGKIVNREALPSRPVLTV